MSAAEALAPPAVVPEPPSAAPPVPAPVHAPVHQEPLARETAPAGPAEVPPAPAAPAAPAPAQKPVRSRPPRASAQRGSLLQRLSRNLVFWLTVVVPTLLSGLYYGLVASDIYVSDAKFVVRMPQRQQGPSLVGALMQGSGFLRSQDDTFTVHEFMQSRDALQLLEQQLALRQAFSAASVDRLSRYPAPWAEDSAESLFRYYGQRVGISFDAATSITSLRVSAFTARDAHAINARLLDLSEQLVNRINERGRNDLIRFAQIEVTQAEQRAKDAAAALAGFRNQRAVFDPERQSGLQLQSASKLQEELTAARGQLAQVVAAAPQNPQIASLRVRVKELESELAAASARVTGGRGSLTDKAGDYERLALERGFAERQLASALVALESARNESRRQQLYLERVVQPSLPDEALEPRRLRNVTATFLIGLLLWGVATLLLSAVREHRH